MGVFRPDPHLPAHACVEKVTPARASAAVRAAAVLELGVAAVDLQEGPAGPVVMAVHASPALKWFERLAGVDAARLIVEFATGETSHT
jgi:ribosomal protein S6--L-glutamate ligase